MKHLTTAAQNLTLKEMRDRACPGMPVPYGTLAQLRRVYEGFVLKLEAHPQQAKEIQFCNDPHDGTLFFWNPRTKTHIAIAPDGTYSGPHQGQPAALLFASLGVNQPRPQCISVAGWHLFVGEYTLSDSAGLPVRYRVESNGQIFIQTPRKWVRLGNRARDPNRQKDRVAQELHLRGKLNHNKTQNKTEGISDE